MKQRLVEDRELDDIARTEYDPDIIEQRVENGEIESWEAALLLGLYTDDNFQALEDDE